MYKGTDTSLGDCSYLETCRLKEMCKFVHYTIDPEDMKRHFSKLHMVEAYQGVPMAESNSESKSGWKSYIPPEFIESKEQRIEKLKKSQKLRVTCFVESVEA